MARATATEMQAMDKKQAQVRAALDKAEGETAVYRYLPKFLLTGPQAAALKNLATARERYGQWTDAVQGWRRWANDGQEPDGYPYPVSFWLRIGDDILSEVGVHVQATETASPVTVVKETVAKTATQVKQAGAAVVDAAVEPWSLKTKLAVGGALGLVVLGAVTAFLGKVNTLTGKDA